MVSWKLFVHVLLTYNTYDDAFFMREIGQTPAWHDWLQRIERTDGLRNGLVLGGAILWTISVLYVNNLLFVLIPLLVCFILATGLSLGPLVPIEREKQRWEILLSVPADVEMILMGKMGGALWRMRHFMLIMTVLLFILAIGIGTISLILLPLERVRTGWSEGVVCGVMFLLVSLGGILFIVDRLQQYLLTITAAIVGGTASANSRTALLAASGASLFMWILEITATGTLMLLQHSDNIRLERGQVLLWATLGPLVTYILNLNLNQAIIYVAGTLLLREILITGLWRWAVHHARP